MAVRMIVVLPVPASPSSIVIPFLLDMPYSTLLNASRWAVVITTKRGFGVRSKGRSRNPKNCSYITPSAHKRVYHHRQARRDSRAKPQVHQQQKPESAV